MNATTNTITNPQIRRNRRIARLSEKDKQKIRSELIRVISLIAFLAIALCACSLRSTWK